MYDLAVVYRIYPGVTKEPIIHSNDKLKLSKLAIKSFRKSLGSLNAKIWILLDNCGEEYKEIFMSNLKEYDLEFINLNGVGNYKTFNMQIEILLKQNYSEFVYFAEDDYIFLPNALEKSLKFMKENDFVDFLSVYDAYDLYNLDFHNYKSKIITYGDLHWRTSSCTTLSFMTRKTALSKTKWIFDTYSKYDNFDSSIWMSLTKNNLFDFRSVYRFFYSADRDFIRILKSWLYCWRQIVFGKKYSLWTPIPSLGTHLDNAGIAPSINWSNVINEIDIKN
tara:strand:- start:15757 stop:16590 length:834 start_codon:yes stop_codon:yes gene_type:complete